MAEGKGYGSVLVVNGVVEKPVRAEEIARLYLDAFLVGVGVYHLQHCRVKSDLKLKPVEVGYVFHKNVDHACVPRAYLQRRGIRTYRRSLLCPARGRLS